MPIAHTTEAESKFQKKYHESLRAFIPALTQFSKDVGHGYSVSFGHSAQIWREALIDDPLLVLTRKSDGQKVGILEIKYNPPHLQNTRKPIPAERVLLQTNHAPFRAPIEISTIQGMGKFPTIFYRQTGRHFHDVLLDALIDLASEYFNYASPHWFPKISFSGRLFEGFRYKKPKTTFSRPAGRKLGNASKKDAALPPFVSRVVSRYCPPLAGKLLNRGSARMLEHELNKNGVLRAEMGNPTGSIFRVKEKLFAKTGRRVKDASNTA